MNQVKSLLSKHAPRTIAIVALLLAPMVSALSARADAPANYYAPANGKQGPALQLALHDIIKDHTVVSYDSLWEHYKTTDCHPDGKPWCIYSDYPFQSFEPKQSGRPGTIGGYITREHSWPKDWWSGTHNAAYSDLFNVLLGDAHVNGQKGIKPLGESGPEAKTFAISKVGPAAPSLGYDGQVFEPADQYKGDFARGYLYFAVRYLTGSDSLDCSKSPMVEPDGHTLKPWAVQLLLKWNRQDPVSEREIRRNDAIFGIQHNRNPFIDHPEYAAAIWEKPAKTLAGVDANYSLEMEQSGGRWSAGGPPEDLFQLLRRKGCDSLRIRIWTKDDGPSGLDYATRLAARAQKAGLKPLPVLFLSDGWADMVKQPQPAAWAKLSFDDKQSAVRSYAERMARRFREAGIQLDTVAIGNEIDFGICGEFESEWPKRVSVPYMKSQIWPRMAALIRAAEEGVLKVDPGAQFILHLARWDEPGYNAGFFLYMRSQGVRVDQMGLSYYPTASKGEKTGLDSFFTHLQLLRDKVQLPVVVCEYAYPSEPKFGGQFADWNHPARGYPLDPEGQKRWLTDFQARVRATPGIIATYYWSPEWCVPGMWQAFALFDTTGVAKPALDALAVPPGN